MFFSGWFGAQGGGGELGKTPGPTSGGGQKGKRGGGGGRKNGRRGKIKNPFLPEGNGGAPFFRGPAGGRACSPFGVFPNSARRGGDVRVLSPCGGWGGFPNFPNPNGKNGKAGGGGPPFEGNGNRGTKNNWNEGSGGGGHNWRLC